jgi:hypothetical protein
MFVCAGDDHIALGSLEFVKAIPVILEQMGFEISWPKYRISRKYVHYCQDFGIHPRYHISIKVDTLKVRLLNQFQKQGGTQFDSADPLIGKAKEIEGQIKYLGRQGNEVIYQMIPYLLRAGMPSYFEKKVYGKGLAFIPTALGGLGVPSSELDWTSAMHMLTQGWMTRKIDPFYKPTEKRFLRIWERSMETYAKAYNFMDVVGVHTLTPVEAFNETKETLSVVSDQAGPPSNKRVIRTMAKERINLLQPQTLLGNKESPYAAVFRGSANTQTVDSKKRAGPLLRENCAIARAYYDAQRPVVLSTDPTVGAGLWAMRSEVQDALHVAFYVPSGNIGKSFFEGEDSRFDYEVKANASYLDE